MDHDWEDEAHKVPSGIVTGLIFTVSNNEEKEKLSVLAIDSVSQLSDPRLGFPNPSKQCSTCGAKVMEDCEGHYGIIQLPYTILHPEFLSVVADILNKICPACKVIRKDLSVKGKMSGGCQPKGCKYCVGNPQYPRMRFRVSSLDSFRKTVIIVEVNEDLVKKSCKKFFGGALPLDYWDFNPKDEQEENSSMKPNRRVLTHAQVHSLLSGVDPKFVQKFVSKLDSLFLNSLPVTPNCQRVTEVTRACSSRQSLAFDGRSKAYRKLVGFRGVANELSCYVLDCLRSSKLVKSDTSSSNESIFTERKRTADSVSHTRGLKFMKDVVLGKLNDSSFRMVVTGDPNIQLSEIGIPCHVAERLQVAEKVTRWNQKKLRAACDLLLLEKGRVLVQRKDASVRIQTSKQLEIGDTIYRHLNDGDIVLVLRPPSIHQHSLIALSVRIFPVSANLSINPLCCPPLRGDFDGDCLHGYIPRKLDAKVELAELVSLDKQLINGQNGRNLLSLSQDSLTAAHLVLEGGVFLNRSQMQQLQMSCPYSLPLPTIVKNKPPPVVVKFPPPACMWTGKQIFDMLLPPDFSFVYPSSGVYISNGELMSFSDGSAWLHDHDMNLFQSLVKHFQGKTLEFLFTAQEVFSEWLSMRGLSVSLADLYLATDSQSRRNLMDEVLCGLEEAEEMCNIKGVMVDSRRNSFVRSGENARSSFQMEHLSHEKQKSAAISQASVDAFKRAFGAVQSLVFEYKDRGNSFWAMYKAGSKGNLLRLVQHSMCLGLQHSPVPLSFRFPHELSCTTWNNQKLSFSASEACDNRSKPYFPSCVVKNSFLSGLNPLESFVHAVTSRGSSFSNHAEVPGTLSRRLMFFMRDLYVAYDGTVRSAYGNQLVQFSYIIDKNASASTSGIQGGHSENIAASKQLAGQPVGSLSACAISEAAYSALDQPISVLESSPLLNLQNVLECGSKQKGSTNLIASLFLSNKLGRYQHGYEYGALEVKNHLERLFFEDIVSVIMIMFTPENCSQMQFSPWVCHFHVCKELARRRGLKVDLIISSLRMSAAGKSDIPSLHITSGDCNVAETYNERNDTFCISISIIENFKRPSVMQDWVRDYLIPFFLQTVVKGFMEIRKVDILWNDKPESRSRQRGELYLRVSLSGESPRTNLWGLLVNNCHQVADMIDWSRSHPVSINAFSSSYGIDAGWNYFLDKLGSSLSDTGKDILPEHLVLLADALSTSGEFVGLNARGISRQRESTSVSSPFVQACFSNPGDCFRKAAKAEIQDDLRGTIEALAWGNIPSVGTGGQFDIIYAGEGTGGREPINVYSRLSTQLSSQMHDSEIHVPSRGSFGHTQPHPSSPESNSLRNIRRLIRAQWTCNDIKKLSLSLKSILKKYPVDEYLSEQDTSILMQVLNFHPRRDEKIGPGAQNIKVAHHSKYQNSRCFELVRSDGSVTDFSYHKCVLGALEIIAPQKARLYASKHIDKS